MKIKFLRNVLLVSVNIIVLAFISSVLWSANRPTALQKFEFQRDEGKFYSFIRQGVNVLNRKDLGVRNIGVALACFSQAIEADPENLNGYVNLATTYMQVGSFHDAIFIFQTALILFPNEGVVHYFLAKCYESIGDEVLARDYAQKSFSIFQGRGDQHGMIKARALLKDRS